MPFEFKFPDVGEGIQEGELVKWLIKEGEPVEVDQNIAEVETDKAVVEMPCPKKGTIQKLHYKEGDTINVGSVFVTIALEGEDASAAPAQESSEQPAEQQSQPQQPAQEQSSEQQPQPAQQAPAQQQSEQSGDQPTPPPAHSADATQPQPQDKKEEGGEERYTGSVVGFLEEAQDVSPLPSGAQQPSQSQQQPQQANQNIQATLAVRKLAKDKGVDLSTVTGTGPNGRITEEDVNKASGGAQQPQPQQPTQQASPEPQPTQPQPQPQQAPAQQGGQPAEAQGKPKRVRKYDFYGFLDRRPMKGIRKKVADHMAESFYTAPQVTNFHTADITKLEEDRKQRKEEYAKEDVKLTSLAYIMKAVANALKEVPEVNSILEDDTIVMKKYYNIGMATDTEDGLMVPVVKRVNFKNLKEVAGEVRKLATDARDRKINLMDLKGGSFTISNLGHLGVEHFTPILNSPESGLLGVGLAKPQPAVIDGEVQVRTMLPLSFTYDHRVVDGAVAGRFMQSVVKQLEGDPAALDQKQEMGGKH